MAAAPDPAEIQRSGADTRHGDVLGNTGESVKAMVADRRLSAELATMGD
jgi:hypothetical protein